MNPPESIEVTHPQPELWQIGRELVTVEDDAKSGKFSGVIIEKNRERVRQICRALAERIGVHRIAKAYGVSVHTVLGIRDRNAELIATEKKDVSLQLGRISKLMADNIEQRLEEGTFKPGSVDLAIILDKKSVADGDPSMIVEHRHTIQGSSAVDFAAKLDAMKRAKGVVTSCGTDDKPQQKENFTQIDAVIDAVEVGPVGGADAGSQSATAASNGAGSGAGEGGGGGVGFQRGMRTDDGLAR